MKIAIVTFAHRRNDKTGDCLQAVKTAQALQNAGHTVAHNYVDEKGTVSDAKGERVGVWNSFYKDYDIIHAIPPIPSKFIERFSALDVPLVASSIFWRSFRYNLVLARNQGMSLRLFVDLLRDLLAMFGVRTFFSYKGYDLILPNSSDEVRNFSRYCLTKKGATVISVPNAIDPIPAWVDKLQRPNFVPADEYIVCPGIFAPRKNQRLLMEAFRDTPYGIVFMGGGGDAYKRYASSNMLFTGHIPHGSEAFYQTLKFARVACLPSNCETPGIALLEAAALGARPVVSFEGGTSQYYGWDAEYFDPLSVESLRLAVVSAWERGRLSVKECSNYRELTWDKTAIFTANAYRQCKAIYEKNK
ncbi:MAG: glycosyltransferase [Kiritimatiellia bacterium]|jgi:glycosyltransferase involved in cell wall biosynthesis